LICRHCGVEILATPQINDHDLDELEKHLDDEHREDARRLYASRVARVTRNFEIERLGIVDRMRRRGEL
jgi:hypothetical protein